MPFDIESASQRTEEDWKHAFETSKLRADYEVAVYLGTDDLNGDDEFYADLAGLSDKHYWDRLAAIARRGVRVTGVMPAFEVLPPFERRQRRPVRLRPPRTNGSAKAILRIDGLRDISASEFYEELTGLPGAPYVCCPLPAHEDNTPSCGLDEGGLWKCFGCGYGGTIYEMAALLWGYPLPLRGAYYGEVRDRLKEMFGVVD